MKKTKIIIVGALILIGAFVNLHCIELSPREKLAWLTKQYRNFENQIRSAPTRAQAQQIRGNAAHFLRAHAAPYVRGLNQFQGCLGQYIDFVDNALIRAYNESVEENRLRTIYGDFGSVYD